MIGHASEWLSVGSIPFALSSGEFAALCLLALLRTPFEAELRVSSFLCLRLRTEPSDDAQRHRSTLR
jgi:hypothetical protein